MTELYNVTEKGDLERVKMLVEQGVDKNQTSGGYFVATALGAAAKNNHFNVVRYLVEQGADMENSSHVCFC